MPEDLTPFPRPGQRLVGGPPSQPQLGFPLTTRRDLVLFACWCAAVFAFSLTLTLAIVHRAVTRPGHQLPTDYLLVCAAAAAGSFVLLAVLGGLVVFETRTPWSVVVLWPLLGGPAVATGYFFGLSGQMDAGSALCDAPANGSCDTAWGLGAIVIAIVASLLLGTLFTITFAAKRLVARARR